MTKNITTHNLGFPRIGGDRELKKAQEGYWRGEINQVQLEDVGRELRKTARTDHAPVHIGSFPQTEHIRQTRSEFKQGKINSVEYENRIRQEIADCIAKQEQLDIDVLVHGEAERNDMVEYFGEQLNGYAFTQFGWVQSYGSRCVKPPIIFGDVSRPAPITVSWARYAQSLSKKPVKGMLTGPITMLFWSFVRDDQPRATTALQIALALRDEVIDLESAGIQVIQIDEPAIREGFPLREKDRKEYLDWAVKAFRISASGVQDERNINFKIAKKSQLPIYPGTDFPPAVWDSCS